MANADPISILNEVLQAAAGVDDFPIIHFEQRGDTFRVWPRDNGAPFTVAVSDSNLIETLTKQVHEGDEAWAALARVKSLIDRRAAREGANASIPIPALIRAINGPEAQ
jgi:hypothetical protein